MILLAYIPGLLPFLYNHLIIHQHHGGTEQESCEIDTKYSQFYNVQKNFSQVLLTKYLPIRILAAEQIMKTECRKQELMTIFTNSTHKRARTVSIGSIEFPAVW